MKKKQMVAVIVLVVAMLVMALPAYAADPNPGEGNTDVVVTNTNQNTGAAAASVTAIYYNQSGAVEYSRPRSINSRGSYNFKASDAQLASGALPARRTAGRSRRSPRISPRATTAAIWPPN